MVECVAAWPGPRSGPARRGGSVQSEARPLSRRSLDNVWPDNEWKQSEVATCQPPPGPLSRPYHIIPVMRRAQAHGYRSMSEQTDWTNH